MHVPDHTAWNTVAALLAVAGSMAWTWVLLESLELAQSPDRYSRPRRTTLAFGATGLVLTVIGAIGAWCMAQSIPSTASLEAPGPITSGTTETAPAIA